MRRIQFLLLCLPFVGCAPSPASVALDAEALSRGSVASALGLLQELADRLAPLAEAGTIDQFALLAESGGASCVLSVDGGATHLLRCDGVELLDGTVNATARVQFLLGDTVVDDPADADRIVATVEVEGPAHLVDGSIEFRSEPGVGIHASGALGGSFGEFSVDADFPALVFHAIADLPEKPFGVVCTQGAVDVVVQGGGGGAHGTAAFTGRDAFVILSSGGVLYQGSVALRPAP